MWFCVVPFVAIGLVIPSADRRRMGLVVLGGLVVRLIIAAAVALFLKGTVYALFDETVRYEEIGRVMADAWRAHRNVDLFDAYQLSVAGYYYIVAGLTFLSGGGPFLIGAFNAMLACLTAPVLYWLASALRATSSERVTAVLIGTFMPSITLWAGLPLKDTTISLAFCLALLAALRVVSATGRQRFTWLGVIAGSTLALSAIRIYATFFVSLFIIALLVLTRTWRGRPRWTAVVLVGVIAVQLWSLQGPERTLITTAATDISTLERIQGMFNGGGSGEVTTRPTPSVVAVRSSAPPASGVVGRSGPRSTAGTTEAPIFTLPAEATEEPPPTPPPGRVERYLFLASHFPVQFIQFYLLPIPFVTRGNAVRLAIPEMLVWYVMLPLAVVGLVALWRRDRGRAAAIAVLSLLMASVYGVIVGNAGSILRYRAQELLLLVTPISVGAHAA